MLMNCKNILTAALLLSALSVSAKSVHVASSSLDVENGKMVADMVLDLKSAPIESKNTAVFTPYILSQGGDSLSFAPFSIYGRRSLIHAQRLNQPMPANWAKAGQQDSIYAFHETVDYTPELNGAELALRVDLYGCANCLKETYWIKGPTWEAPTFNPAEAVVFEVPVATVVKERAASGRANVEFQVNRTVLLPDFRNNAQELAEVARTIESVKGDPDVTITGIFLKGFASPEGSYSNNTRLAKGRTEALSNWIKDRYGLSNDLIHPAYEPEDWDGLRSALESDPFFPERDGLLAIVNEPGLTPDARDQKLKATYTQAYQRLLAEIYPALRHTDYRVEYTIRTFTTAEEVMAVIAQDPSKLSAAEFFLAAQSLDPADPRYEELIMMAVKYDPTSEAANLNAASIALKHGDLPAADSYLQHAGKSPAAEYTRGLLAIEADDLTAAEQHLRNALDEGYTPAASVIEKLSFLKKIKK